MDPTSTVDDTFLATRLMRRGRRGGDRRAGRRRHAPRGGARMRAAATLPIAGLSTGTNNAFPEMREPTITGMAVGLYATRPAAAGQALAPQQADRGARSTQRPARTTSRSSMPSSRRDRYIGARALWKTETPGRHLPGLRRPAGDRPVGHRRAAAAGGPARGRRPRGAARRRRRRTRRLALHAPIAPGMVRRCRHRALAAHGGRIEPLPVAHAGRHRRARRRARAGLRAPASACASRCARTLSPPWTWPAACTPAAREGLFRLPRQPP